MAVGKKTKKTDVEPINEVKADKVSGEGIAHPTIPREGFKI